MPDANPPSTTARRGPARLRQLRPTPVLVVLACATAPLAGFVYDNRYDLPDVAAVTPWWFATVAFGLLLLAGLTMATRRASVDALALVAGVVVASFYQFGRFSGAASPDVASLVRFAAIVGLVAFAVFRLATVPTARRFVGLLAVMLAVVPLLGYAAWRVSATAQAPHTARPSTAPTPTVDPAAADADVRLAGDGADADAADLASAGVAVAEDVAARPDVYVFVLDERARGDELAGRLGLDTSAFEAELTELGFSVSPTSFAAYPKTLLSLSSLFEMDYVATAPADVSDGLLRYRSLLEGDSQFVRAMRAQGYQHVYAHPGAFDWLGCDPTLADVCIEPRTDSLRLSEVDRTIAEMTPLQLLTSQTLLPYTDPVYVADQARQARTDAPQLVVGHILSPHGPYRYTDSCALRETFVEAAALDADGRKAAYLQDVICTDALTLQAVRSIVLRDPDAVIVVLSDHGSNFEIEGPTQAAWTEAGIVERFGVLDAVRAPGCDLPEERGVLVNLLRRVQACLDGTEPDLLPDRAFTWWEENPLGLEELPDAAARLQHPQR
ncbi:MAG: sulfatase-like hydrolase/transferase [Acidimicrobiales bacterium]|nr:sulfatase-like hydrolase/transferase [Acidimicrobiales bacterium]